MSYVNELKQQNIIQFLAHEIRNPLTAINLAAEAIRKQLPASSLLTDTSSQMAAIITRNAAHIEFLMKKLLSYNEAFAEYETEIVYIKDTINSCLDKVADRLHLKKITLEQYVTSRLPVRGLPDQLCLAFINIIINAVEAVEETVGKICIHAFDVNNKVIVIIKDNGPGMEKHFIENIFQQKISGKTKGLGLGLSHVKEILDFHMAEIAVKSKKGEGSSFQVVLHTNENS